MYFTREINASQAWYNVLLSKSILLLISQCVGDANVSVAAMGVVDTRLV